MGSTALMSSSKTIESWMFAALSITQSGMPIRSQTTWRFEPFFPLSVGFAPVFSPPGGGHTCRVQRSPLPVDLLSFS